MVIPTRDEEANVEPLLLRLATSLESIDHEILFVDDSDDRTPRLLAAARATDPRVGLVHRRGVEREGGLSTAVLRGLHGAHGEFVCVMDADLQHPPENIPAMLEAAIGGADVVVASRYTRGGSGHGLDGTLRRLVSRGAGAVARALFREARASSDPLSGFFICRRGVIDGIEFRPVGFKVLLELLVCIPDLRVSDVPLDFASRTAGASKASLGQGLLFLGHLRSLFVDVQGSARRWKFGLVGISGLAILLPLIAVLTAIAGLPPLAAFLPAYVPSLIWNTVLNRHWTFADQRHGIGEGTARYLEHAILSGAAMFAAYAGLLAGRLTPVLCAFGGAMVAMAVNAAGNHAAVHRRPRLWGELATSLGVQAALARITAEVGADRSYVLPPAGAAPAALPPGTVERVVSRRRAVLFTESANHRTQRRSNIEVGSTLVAPIVDGGVVRGVLVCERVSHHPFQPGDLEAAMTAAPALGGLIACAPSAGSARRPAFLTGTIKV